MAPCATTWSSASAHGSGFMTMPAPPPNGLSSTVRCRSWAKSRRSCTRTSRMPSRRALPMSDRSSGARYSGKIETTSTRTGVTPRGRAARAGRRRRRGPPSRSTSGTIAATKGTCASRPSGSRTTSRSWAAPRSRPADLAEHGAGGVDDGQPAQLVLGEDVVLVGAGSTSADRRRPGGCRAATRRRCGRGSPRTRRARCRCAPGSSARSARGAPRCRWPPRCRARRRRRAGARARRCAAARSPRRAGRAACRSGRRRWSRLTGPSCRGDAVWDDDGGVCRGVSSRHTPPSCGGRVSGPGRCRRCRCGPGDRRRAHP